MVGQSIPDKIHGEELKQVRSAESETDASRPSHVVGIGASAGGLEALEQFFDVMPPESGMAFVVIQHLSPDFKSLMDELLSHRTSMPVHRVLDGMQVQANAIYLIPPKKEMIIADGRLLLTDKEPGQALTLPIDRFFRSLAQDVGRDAIAIVLSGTGSDGSRGVREVHEAGGLVIVQSEESAKFDGMPKNAIETGVADLQLRPAEIPAALLRYIQHPIAVAMMDDQEDVEGRDNDMGRLFKLLRKNYGIDFSHYKPSTVARRIERRLLMKHIDSVEEYVERLSSDTEELNSLYKDLLIGVTKFFRDAEAFCRLENEVIPELLLKAPANEEIRIWVAGCATGEEAYSLAILFHERIEECKRPLNVKIFATDVHRASIDYASAGIYPQQSLSELSDNRLQRYFTSKGDKFQVASDLRQMIVFAHHNIIKDAPFTKMDLITCRNLLIYFQPLAQKKALSLFHFGLKTGGILFLGPSESPAELAEEFEPVDHHWKIFRKRRNIRLPADMRLPLSTGAAHLHSTSLSPSQISNRGWDNRLYGSYDALLEEFMPSGLLVDESRELLHVFGDGARYLAFRTGRASANVVDLVIPELRLAVSGTLTRFEKNKSETVLNGVCVGDDGRMTLRVKPVRNKMTNTTQILITLEVDELPVSSPPLGDNSAEMNIVEASRDRLELLENELRYTKENLQATVEELETSNEELQATNEELVASNEELQSTNEELHSVNEELYTVNAEYQRKINELTQLNSDMDNLLDSTEIGTIFLDSEMCVRKFTPQISRTFNLLPQDVGRRIDAFTHHIDIPGLVDEIKHVLQTGEPFEQQVRGHQAEWYFLRIFPYRSSTGNVEGTVVTLIDISALKRAQSAYREVDRRLTGILDNSTAFIYVKDLDGRYTLCNRVSEQILNASPEQVCGRTDYDFLPTELADIIQSHDLQVAANGSVAEFEETFPCDGVDRTFLAIKFPLRDESSEIYGVGAVCTDITERKHATEIARQRVRHRDQFLAMLSHELRNPVGAIVNANRVLDHEPSAASVAEARRVITRQSLHMSRILDDLLDVSRVTQGKIELRREVVDLRATINDAIAAVTPLIKKRRQQLHTKLPDEPVYVEADPTRLQQIQANLLTNASKYNAEAGNIWLTLTNAGENAILSVRDDGVGIPQEMQESIFDLFVQSDAPHSDGGLGVGLTLARSIIEKHEGSISVKSDGLGAGSEFLVFLPTTSKRPSQQSELIQSSNNHNAKILIVEDNDDARETLQKLLKLEGYDVTSANDGHAALSIIEQLRPDIALIDIGLPDLNGYELAKKIRSTDSVNHMLLVALTGFGQASDRQQALDAGFNAHLVKPLDTEKLDQIISNRMAKSSN